MPMTKPKTATVERHRYVLDWFERDKIELDLEHSHYKFSYRFGPDWFLEGRRLNEETGEWEEIVWPRGGSFNIANPGEALAALGDRVTEFTCISTGMQFQRAMSDLLSRASTIRDRQQVTP